MALAPGGGGTAAHTPHIARDEGAAQARRDEAQSTAELQRHLLVVEQDLGDRAVTRQHQGEFLRDRTTPFEAERRRLTEPLRIRRFVLGGDEIARLRGEHHVRFDSTLGGDGAGGEREVQHRGEPVAVAFLRGAVVGGAIRGGRRLGQRRQRGAQLVPVEGVEVADDAGASRPGLGDLQVVAIAVRPAAAIRRTPSTASDAWRTRGRISRPATLSSTVRVCGGTAESPVPSPVGESADSGRAGRFAGAVRRARSAVSRHQSVTPRVREEGPAACRRVSPSAGWDDPKSPIRCSARPGAGDGPRMLTRESGCG